MKQTFLFIFLLVSLASSCQTNTDFKKIEWLIGNWKGETNGQPFYENWEKISETEFDNINYTICNGDTSRSGHSKIEIRNGKIAYTSDNITWELKELNDSLVIFENDQRKEKFSFTKTTKGEWRANLQYPRTKVEYLLAKTVPVSELLKNKPAPINGNYKGYLEFKGKKLETSINFEYRNGKQMASITTPVNLQLNTPVNEVCYDPPFLKIKLRDGTQMLELNAKLEDNKISGKLSGEIPANIFLQKADLPRKSNDYRILPLEIINGNIKLPANLFLPKSNKPVGAVIMVCGSGPHTKEEYNGWADLLASKGVAVLTYDKRNVSTFPNLNIRQASSDIVLPGELESDVKAAILILQGRKEINPEKIGLLGFSQGAVIAPVVAVTTKDVAFIVAISGNTTTDKEFIITQSINKLRQKNFNDEVLKQTTEIWLDLFQFTKDKLNGDEIQKKLDNAYEKGFGRFALPRYIPNDDEIKYLSTWNSFEHNPVKYWTTITIPSYVVFGVEDMLIPVPESIQILNSLFRHRPNILTLKIYPGANHFIKQVPDKINFDFPKYVEGYISDLTEWILKQTK